MNDLLIMIDNKTDGPSYLKTVVILIMMVVVVITMRLLGKSFAKGLRFSTSFHYSNSNSSTDYISIQT